MTCRKPGSANARPSGEAPGVVVSSRRARCHALKTGGVQSARDRATHHHLGSSPGDGQIAATPPTGVIEGKTQPVRLKSWAWRQHLTISATYSEAFIWQIFTDTPDHASWDTVNETYSPRPHTHTHTHTHTHRHAQKHKHTQTHGHTHTYVETHIHKDTNIHRYIHTDAHVNTHRPRYIYHSVQFSCSAMSDSL